MFAMGDCMLRRTRSVVSLMVASPLSAISMISHRCVVSRLVTDVPMPCGSSISLCTLSLYTSSVPSVNFHLSSMLWDGSDGTPRVWGGADAKARRHRKRAAGTAARTGIRRAA